MTWYEDLSQRTMITAGEHVRAIGWLAKYVDYPTGDCDSEFTEKLSCITKECGQSEFALGWTFDSFFGFHTCEFCEDFRHGGNFGVPSGELLYVAPAMVSHYVEEHNYRPPEEFVEAVLQSPIPGNSHYKELAAKFIPYQEFYRKRELEVEHEAARKRCNEINKRIKENKSSGDS